MIRWMRLLLLSVFVLAQAAGAAQALIPVEAPLTGHADMRHAAPETLSTACADCDGGAVVAATCADCQAACAVMAVMPPTPRALGALRGPSTLRPVSAVRPGQASPDPPRRPPSVP